MMIRMAFRRFSSKFYKTGEEALKDVKDGAKLLVAGFGVAGVAENCLRIVGNMNRKNLTICSNSIGMPGWGPGALVDDHRVSKIITCFIGGNPSAEKQYLKGELEAEYMPQGSLVERLRSTQAGVAGFFSVTGLGTAIEEGAFSTKVRPDGTEEKKAPSYERHTIDGKEYIFYPAYDKADFCFVKAYVADKYGNLRYRRAARNFNPNIAGAGKVTIAEAEYMVDQLPPEKIHTPGCYIDRIFQGDIFTHKIERLVLRYPPSEFDIKKPANPKRTKILKRAIKELKTGMYINLGVGIPAEIPSMLPEKFDFTLQVENGIVGGSLYPLYNEICVDTINAAKEPITVIPGFSVSSSATSFGMMRGKHIHMTVLGGFQVSETGDLANWMIPGVRAKGMGGAMDLASCVPRVMVTMEHMQGEHPRILPKCTYPLTAKNCVSTIVTELAVFEFENGKLFLKEKVKEMSLDQIKKMTPANYIVDPNLKDYQES